MSKFDPLKGLTEEKKKNFNFNPLKGISNEPIVSATPAVAPTPANNFNMPVSYLSQGKTTPPAPPQDESFLKKTARVLLPKAAEEFLGMNKTQEDKDFTAAYENKWAIEDMKKLQGQIDPVTGKLPTQTAGGVLKDTPGESYLPFVGAIPSIKDAISLYGAAKRLESGETTPVDDYILAKFKAESERDSTFGAKVTNVLTALPSFAGELALTGGISTIVKNATQKAITKGLKTTVEKSAKRKLAESILTRSIGNIAGGTAQTVPARFMEITAETIQNMTPEYQYRPGEDGLFNAYISKEGDNVWQAAAKAFSNQWVEVVSEKSGGIFNEMLGPVKNKLMKLSLFKSLLKNNPTLTSSQFMQLVNSAGWNGVIAEMGEERIGEAMRGILTQIGLSEEGFKFPTADQLAVELVSFGIPGVMIGAVNKGLQGGSFKQPQPTVDIPPPPTVPPPPAGPGGSYARVDNELGPKGKDEFVSGKPIDIVLDNNKTIDVAKTESQLPPVQDGFERFYRAESPTIKHSDAWGEQGGMLPTGFNKGDSFHLTPDIKYADYYKSTYGKDAKISYFDLPKGLAKPSDKFEGEFTVNKTQLSDIWDKSQTITDNEASAQGEGHQKFYTELDQMVKDKTLLPEDSTIIKTLLEGTDDSYLGALNFGEKGPKGSYGSYGSFSVPTLPRPRGSRARKTADMSRVLKEHTFRLAKRLADSGEDATRVFAHEFGHAGYYLLLTDEERAMVNDVYRQLGGTRTKSIFDAGLGGNTQHHAENVREFFAQSFAEYIMSNKIPPAQLQPLYKRLAAKFFEGLKRLVNRKENVAVDKLRPLFERALTGDKTTPLSELMQREPTSFKQQVQQMFQQAPTKEVPPASIFPSMAVQNNKIEPMTPEEISAAPTVEGEPFDLPPEAPEPVSEAHKRTPDSQKIGWVEKLSSPLYVLEKLGLRAQYQDLKKAHLAIHKEKVIIREKLKKWMSEVPGKESAKKIFDYLDGEAIQLSQQEAKVAGEIKVWLSEWADRMGLKKEDRITNYITHIFPKEKNQGIPESIATLIRNKIPGEVYNPYLLERMGADGYIKDVWLALEAYSNRAVRKVHLDPALESLKELVGPGKQVSEDSQVQYVQDFVDHVNMRPTVADTVTDNTIKKIFGKFSDRFFGPRPTRTITMTLRKLISGSKIGGSLINFAKNLTQSVNTYSELGEKYVVIGYIDLVRNGGQELKDNGVLLDSLAEDQVYSAVKKYAETYDKVLYLNMNASELMNRGAAYYGAKAKFLAGKITPKEYKKAFGTEMPENYTPTKGDAISYGKFIAEKTQFVFGALDNPVVLNSDLSKTMFQYSTYPLKQQELILRRIGDKEWAKSIRYVFSSLLMFGLIGQVFGMRWNDTFPFFQFGLPPVLKFIYQDLFVTGILGKDKYGGDLDLGERALSIGKSFLTNVVPGGSQAKRTYEGIKTVNEGGVKNKSGYYDYKVAQTPLNYVRGALFGSSNLPETKDYYKNKDEKKKGSSVSKSKSKFNPLKGM